MKVGLEVQLDCTMGCAGLLEEFLEVYNKYKSVYVVEEGDM